MKSTNSLQLSEIRPGGTPTGNDVPLAIRHSEAPALIASMTFHVILLLCLAWWTTHAPQGSGDVPDRNIGIAVVHHQPDRTRYVDAKELSETVVEKQNSAGLPSESTISAPPADLAPPLELEGLLDAMLGAPSPTASTGLAGDLSLSGATLGGNLGQDRQTNPNETTTMVFGVSGSGSRFVYVFDRSDSMNSANARPLRAAKRELIRSLKTLSDRQQFQIIFYNDKPTPFQIVGMPLQLMRGEADYITQAVRYVQSVKAFGGTEHESALKMALNMSPDVIFFLTDARIPRLSHSELQEIKRRADGNGTSIHAIEFGTDAVEPEFSFLRELAQMNHGQYQYVSTLALSDTP